jgi:hypothetical protein
MMTEDSYPPGTAPIPGLENFRAGRDGSIWSRPRRGSHKNWKKMKLILRGKHYIVRARDGAGKKAKPYFVHILVLRAFKGEPPPGKTMCCHWNDIGTDNRLENLRWGDHYDQANDRARNGTTTRGERASRSRLADKDVYDLRRRKMDGKKIDIRAEASKWGMSYSSMWDILNCKSYKHIDPSVEWCERLSSQTNDQTSGEDEQCATPLEKLLSLWSQLTEGEQKEFLSKIQLHRSLG